MADAVIAIKIVTDAAAAKRGMAAAGTSVGKMQTALSKMVVPAAAAVVAIGAFGVAAYKSASRTQQAMGAVESVFGKNAGQVKRWADAAATSVGLAKSEYMELASVIGAQLKNMGIPLDQVASKTNTLVGLGSDLAATYGGTTKEAVEALGSALRGETDPIEKYGISIKQADIQAQMAKDGTDKLTGAAAKQAKTMTLLAMITKQSADSHGQFAEESGSAAGASQIAAAQFENMKSALGTSLLPIISKVAAALGKLAAWMMKNQTATKIIIGVILALSVAIIVLTVAVNLYVWSTTSAAAATLALWAAAALPVVLVIAAVLAVVAVVVLLWKKCDWFRNSVKAVWRAVSDGARAAARWVTSVWTTSWSKITAAARKVASAARSVFNSIRAAVASVIGAAQRLIAKLKSIRVPGFIAAAFHNIRNAVSNVIGKVSSLIGKLRSIRVPGAVVSALHAIKSAAESVMSAIGRLISKIKDIPVPHISWPKPPAWFGKLKPGSMMVTPEGPTALGRYVAPTGRTGRVAGRALTPSPAGPTIVIQGALDPEGVARQIQRIMGGHTRRMGHAAA